MDKARQTPCQQLVVIILKACFFAVFKCFSPSKGKLEVIRIFLAGKRLNCCMKKAILCKTDLQKSEPIPQHKTGKLARELLLQILMQIQAQPRRSAYPECASNLCCTAYRVNKQLLLKQ